MMASTESKSHNLVNKLSSRETAHLTWNQSSKLWSRSIIDNYLDYSRTFYYKDLYGHYGCVNSIEFSPDGNLLASGSDDKRVLLWNVWASINESNYEPQSMKSEHSSNIFCISFDSSQKRIFSGGNDELVIIHNIETGEAIEVITHMDDVYGLSVDPFNHNIFASASSDIMLWDIRCPTAKSTQLAVGVNPFHAVMHNPVDSNIVVTANSKDGIDLYDIRKPMHKLFRFYSSSIIKSQCAMCVRFNRTGNLILALRRRLSPVLYDIRSPYPVVEFESNDYYNSCTLKNCTFAGENDQFVASGSDNFKVFLWKIPDHIVNDSNKDSPLKENTINYVPDAQQVLTGHRSIVNQVIFNDRSGFIASAGVEKIIKIWSPLVEFNSDNITDSKESAFTRNFYSYQDYLQFVHNDRYYVAHDYSGNNISEDARMIAYFDSMIERDMGSYSVSSSDDESLSFFNYVEFDPAEDSSDNEQVNYEISHNEISTDSDEMFSIEKMFDFNRNLDRTQLKEDNYLNFVFAKRIHARYITSYVDNLISLIEKKACDKKKCTVDKEKNNLESNAETALSSGNNRKCSKDTTVNVSNLSNTNNGHTIARRNQGIQASIRDFLSLIQKIKTKKQTLLVFDAFKITKTLLLSFNYGTLYKKSKNKYYEDNFDNEKLDQICSKHVETQIKKMSKLKAKNLCDKRLFNLLNRLYNKVVHLKSLLNDYDMKSKYEDYIKHLNRNSIHPQLLFSALDNSDDESEFDVDDDENEEANDDIVMDDSNESSLISSISSSTSISSSSSSSSTTSSDDDEMNLIFNYNDEESRRNKTNTNAESNNVVDITKATGDNDGGDDNNNNDVSSMVDLSNNHPQSASTSSNINHATNDNDVNNFLLSQSGTSSNKIFFKKIDRRNKNYKQQNKPHKKVCKNKRKRK